MKEIEIHNRPGIFVKVDDADFDMLSRYRWALYPHSKGYDYAVGQVDGVRQYMHRFLAGVPGLVVDHINGDTLDNRRENLRAVTNAENCRNRHAAVKSSSGHLNIQYRAKKGYYVAYHAKASGGRVYLGYFKALDDALAAQRAYAATHTESKEHTLTALVRRVVELEKLLSERSA